MEKSVSPPEVNPSQTSSILKDRNSRHFIIQQEIERQRAIIVPLLANRSTHLPGNTWNQDWIEYLKNNHILFGICLHHPFHPVQGLKRIVAFVGSIAFGLSSTTLLYLWDIFDPERMRNTLFYIPWIKDDFVVTYGMILLWTVGGGLHSIFDLMVWYIMACSCCIEGGFFYRKKIRKKKKKKSNVNDDDVTVNTSISHELDASRKSWQHYVKDCGFYIIFPVILTLVAIMGLAVLVRASLDTSGFDNEGGDDGVNDDGNDLEYSSSHSSIFYPIRYINMDGLQVESFSFVVEYIILLTLSWFVYFPIGVTIFFSGVLGCNGRIPVLGGRPYDKARLEKSLLEKDDDKSAIEMT